MRITEIILVKTVKQWEEEKATKNKSSVIL